MHIYGFIKYMSSNQCPSLKTVILKLTFKFDIARHEFKEKNGINLYGNLFINFVH